MERVLSVRSGCAGGPWGVTGSWGRWVVGGVRKESSVGWCWVEGDSAPWGWGSEGGGCGGVRGVLYIDW
ncbi:hypothetical protein Pen01_69680 [Phytomonospora endophytica]|nr:hypothetical protein Pen01_69680 [Phytomonospora endophytica]